METIPAICKNLKRSDIILAYITGNEKSPGLTFEMVYSKILNKPLNIIFKGTNLNCLLEKKLAKNIIEINDIDELKEKLTQYLT